MGIVYITGRITSHNVSELLEGLSDLGGSQELVEVPRTEEHRTYSGADLDGLRRPDHHLGMSRKPRLTQVGPIRGPVVHKSPTVFGPLKPRVLFRDGDVLDGDVVFPSPAHREEIRVTRLAGSAQYTNPVVVIDPRPSIDRSERLAGARRVKSIIIFRGDDDDYVVAVLVLEVGPIQLGRVLNELI